MKKLTGILKIILIWVGMLECGITHIQNMVHVVIMGICWMFHFRSRMA